MKKILLTLSQKEALMKQYAFLSEELEKIGKNLERTDVEVRTTEGKEGSVTIIDNDRLDYLKCFDDWKKIQKIISCAQVVQNMDSDIIGYGTQFSLKSLEDGEEVTRVLVPTAARDRRNEVSIQSPLGKAVVGRRVGDSFSYDCSGKNFEWVVTGISNPYNLEKGDKPKSFVKCPSNQSTKK